MKNKYDINSLKELKARKAALKAEYIMQGDAILADTKSYIANISIFSLFKDKPLDPLNFIKVDGKINPAGKAMSYILPFVMKNTLFRGSGFIVKALVGLASRKIGKKVNGEQVIRLADKVKSWFGKPKIKEPGLQAPLQ